MTHHTPFDCPPGRISAPATSLSADQLAGGEHTVPPCDFINEVTG